MSSRLEDLEVNRFLASAELLGQLSALPAWEAWEGLLREMRQAALEELASGSDPGEFRYWQGVAGALGEILSRPKRIIAAAAEFTAIEEADRKGLRPDLRAIVGLGTDHEGDV